MNPVNVQIGDLLKSRAQTLVNTVNCVGVMGKGIALDFKKKFPAMYEDYVRRCDRHEVRLGKPYLFKQTHGQWVLNFPTKDHWRSVSKLSDIVAGLEYLQQHYREWGIRSLAVPPLGCGNGQLDWEVVGPTLYRHLSKLGVPVDLYAPHGTPSAQLQLDFLMGAVPTNGHDSSHSPRVPKVSPAAVALVGVLNRVTKEPYHWPIGRIAFQKIAYFATECGLPTGLTYERGSYGPYSSQLKRLVAQLENNGLLTETQMGRMFVVRPGPTYKDARDRDREILRKWTQLVERVADLFLRLPRTVDAEIVATVHFVAKEMEHSRGHSESISEAEVFEEVKRWKARRDPPFPDEDVARAIRNLNMLGWIKARGADDLIEDEVA